MKRLLFIGVTLSVCFLLLFGCKESKGRFYTLVESYGNGWITTEDLMNIAFYYRGSKYEGFVPKAKKPETLSLETESSIKQLYLDDLKKSVPEATLEDIYIATYYGTYGNCVIVKVWDNIVDYDLSFIPEQLIGGVLFREYCEREILVWRSQ